MLQFSKNYFRRSSTTSKSYRLSAIGRKNQCVSHTDTGFSITSDLPSVSGGSNQGPQPVELLLAALAGCKQATAQFVARHMRPRLHIERIEFDLHATRLPLGAVALPLSAIEVNGAVPPSRPASVEGTATVFTASSHAQPSAEQLRELARQVERRCPVASALSASGCRLAISWAPGPVHSASGA